MVKHVENEKELKNQEMIPQVEKDKIKRYQNKEKKSR